MWAETFVGQCSPRTFSGQKCLETNVRNCGQIRFRWDSRGFGAERARFFFKYKKGGKRELKVSFRECELRARHVASFGAWRTRSGFFFGTDPPSRQRCCLPFSRTQPGAKRIISNPLLKASRRATISIARGLTSRGWVTRSAWIIARSIADLLHFALRDPSWWSNELFFIDNLNNLDRKCVSIISRRQNVRMTCDLRMYKTFLKTFSKW